MEAWQISILLAVVLAIGELLSFSFILLGFSLGMVVVAIVQALAGGFSPTRDVLIFAVASFVAVVACRRIFGRRSDQQTLDQDDINRY